MPLRRSVRTLTFALGVFVLLAARPSPTRGARLWETESGERYLVLSPSLKWTALLARGPGDSLLFPERWSSASLWRLRVTLTGRWGEQGGIEFADEWRARHLSAGSGAGGGSGILFAEGEVPYRIETLDREVVGIGDSYALRHELDRANLTLRLGPAETTLGRQALGWGRGLFFGAVDLFAPFTPLESDREWRRGIDALRISIALGRQVAGELVAVGGERRETSALLGRLHGYLGDVDAELIVGARRNDQVYGLSASAPLGGAEVHGELALFDTPEGLPEGGDWGVADRAVKAVLGGARSVEVGRGLWLAAEYHYSGFGLSDALTPEAQEARTWFATRAPWGDSQILGRHAAALQLIYGIQSVFPLTLAWVFSPRDGSGVVTTGVRWSFSDHLTLRGEVYGPHGARPGAGTLRSEYGATAWSGLVQVALCL